LSLKILNYFYGFWADNSSSLSSISAHTVCHRLTSTLFFLKNAALTMFTGLLIYTQLTFLTHNSSNISVCHFYFKIPLKFSCINYILFLLPVPYTSFLFQHYPYFYHGKLIYIFHVFPDFHFDGRRRSVNQSYFHKTSHRFNNGAGLVSESHFFDK
jgi:hypothetical protein